MVVSLVGSVAFAQSVGNTSEKIEKKIEKVETKIKSWVDNDPEKSLGVGIGSGVESVVMRQDGSFRVTGAVVNSVNGYSVNVSLYGFSRDVSLAGAELTGSGGSITMSDIKAGDKLSARGVYNKTTKVITVTKVLDISSKKSSEMANIEARINELFALLEKLRAQLKAASGL